jgi:hypothetical protein
MRLKILLPPILLALLLTPASFAQTPRESPENSANAYGIEPEQFYPGTLILRLMEAAEEELDAAVNEAFAEGYKAGQTAYMPDAVYYRALSESLESDLAGARRKLPGWVSFAAGFAGGFLAHILIAR